MAVESSPRPSDSVSVASTTPGNPNTPSYLGHVDYSAFNHDYFKDNPNSPVTSLDTNRLGEEILPTGIPITDDVRRSPFQSNTGGVLKANVKLEVMNAFPYEMKPDDHHAPVNWEAYKRQFELHDAFHDALLAKYPNTYMLVTTPSGLTAALSTEGRIGVIKSVEGLPQRLEVPLGQAAKAIADTKTVIVDAVWNDRNNFFGQPHGNTEKEGVTAQGFAFMEALADAGIPVLDVSHANEATALDMITHFDPRLFVIASHTGARIGAASERTRNASDKVLQAVFERGGIVGAAASGLMSGGKELENVVGVIRRLVELDPTGGKLVTLGPDFNGISLASKINDFGTVLELPNLAEALKKDGFNQDEIENIFWKNAYDFWHNALQATA